MDYAGPILKAAHLELVTELTTEAFIATLRRFISRKGSPSDVFSDHGTNFVWERLRNLLNCGSTRTTLKFRR